VNTEKASKKLFLYLQHGSNNPAALSMKIWYQYLLITCLCMLPMKEYTSTCWVGERLFYHSNMCTVTRFHALVEMPIADKFMICKGTWHSEGTCCTPLLEWFISLSCDIWARQGDPTRLTQLVDPEQRAVQCSQSIQPISELCHTSARLGIIHCHKWLKPHYPIYR
jgi:hypothetical protein